MKGGTQDMQEPRRTPNSATQEEVTAGLTSHLQDKEEASRGLQQDGFRDRYVLLTGAFALLE